MISLFLLNILVEYSNIQDYDDREQCKIFYYEDAALHNIGEKYFMPTIVNYFCKNSRQISLCVITSINNMTRLSVCFALYNSDLLYEYEEEEFLWRLSGSLMEL